VTGTFVNVAAVLAGALIGTLVGGRLPEGIHQRVLAGLGMVTLVIGIDNALQWNDGEGGRVLLSVLGAVLLGGIAGELMGIEARLQRLGDRLQRRFSGDGESTLSEGFFTASLLFCVGPLTVLGSIADGLRGDTELLLTKSLLDGFASIALAAALGPGVALSAVAVLVIQGSISLGAGLFEDVLTGEKLGRADERRRHPHHRDLAQAARHPGREGRQLPPGARPRAGDRRGCAGARVGGGR
jgi:uncharacterized membrane protein YqgA involved in biofilm formation